MKIIPCGDRLLVELLADAAPAQNRIIAAPTANKEQLQHTERGIVRAKGKRCTSAAPVGDEVLVLTNHGMPVPGTTAKLFFTPHVIALNNPEKETHAEA